MYITVLPGSRGMSFKRMEPLYWMDSTSHLSRLMAQRLNASLAFSGPSGAHQSDTMRAIALAFLVACSITSTRAAEPITPYGAISYALAADGWMHTIATECQSDL